MYYKIHRLLLGLMALACGFLIAVFVVPPADKIRTVSPDPIAQNTVEPGPYIINLASRKEPFEMANLRDLEALGDYRLYVSQATIDGTIWHRLRLGFFPDAESAARMAKSLAKSYPHVWVTRASREERNQHGSDRVVATTSAQEQLAIIMVSARSAMTTGERPRAASMKRVGLPTASAESPAIPSAEIVTTRCDELTAHPWDPSKIGDGVYWNRIRAVEAVRACESAVQSDASPRNMAQYARALAKSMRFQEAARWYRESARQGYVHAQYALGDVYEFGEGVETNYLVAQNWYKKAAEQGYAHAETRLRRLHQASITDTRRQLATLDQVRHSEQ